MDTPGQKGIDAFDGPGDWPSHGLLPAALWARMDARRHGRDGFFDRLLDPLELGLTR